jgi:hypothetical protein
MIRWFFALAIMAPLVLLSAQEQQPGSSRWPRAARPLALSSARAAE